MKKKIGELQGKPIVIDKECKGNHVTDKEIYAELSDGKVTLSERGNDGSFKAITGGGEGVIEKAIEDLHGEYYKININESIIKQIIKQKEHIDVNIYNFDSYAIGLVPVVYEGLLVVNGGEIDYDDIIKLEYINIECYGEVVDEETIYEDTLYLDDVAPYLEKITKEQFMQAVKEAIISRK